MPKIFFWFCHFFTTKSSFKVCASACPIKLTDSCPKKGLGMMTSCWEPGNLTTSLCDPNFCFGKGDIYLFSMSAVTWNAAVIRTINAILATWVSWSDVTSHQSLIAKSTWLGMAEGRTLKLDFMVKKWQDQKNYFWDTYCIYALCRFQDYKKPVGCIDTFTFKLLN